MKKEFILERQGKSFVLYAGLLDEAHAQGLKRITTRLIQTPEESNGNVAICSAEVETEKGIFSGIGDASPGNVSQMMATCLIRMAETRAKARALRDAVNVGVAAAEELDEELTADQDAQQEPEHVPMAEKPRPPMSNLQKATPQQIKAIYAIGKSIGLPQSGVEAMAVEAFRKGLEYLSKAEASQMIDALKKRTG
ncbi:MAG: hypothetical protein M1358_14275 [Chloroflexi bacterium]|nr:hypothetical protein [Chloroflexota bacterium]